MIYIGSEYAISADETCYTLYKAMAATKNTKEHKVGEKYYKSMDLYFRNVGSCVNWIIRRMCRKVVENEDMTLTEALQRFKEVENQVREWAGGSFDA